MVTEEDADKIKNLLLDTYNPNGTAPFKLKDKDLIVDLMGNCIFVSGDGKRMPHELEDTVNSTALVSEAGITMSAESLGSILQQVGPVSLQHLCY